MPANGRLASNLILGCENLAGLSWTPPADVARQ